MSNLRYLLCPVIHGSDSIVRLGARLSVVGFKPQRLGKNPGDDFLMECWVDDPALQIVIKKLVLFQINETLTLDTFFI